MCHCVSNESWKVFQWKLLSGPCLGSCCQGFLQKGTEAGPGKQLVEAAERQEADLEGGEGLGTSGLEEEWVS